MNAVPATTLDTALASARRTLQIEAQALHDLEQRLNHDFPRAVDMLLKCTGRVVVSGIGKTGHIARKIAATLASTGTPAFFLHAAEAIHGDLGMITRHDVVIAISYSGAGQELLTILPVARRMGASLIAITGNPLSELSGLADVHLDASVAQEACPLNLAPTASTTVALALGDALAVACLEARGFGPDDFARSHPGGALGRRLLTHVRDVMRSGSAAPHVRPETPLAAAILEMSRGGIGMTTVVDEQQRVIGIVTDGDLRRAFARNLDLRTLSTADIMGRRPHTITPEKLAVEAVEMMENFKINQLPVVDEESRLLGALNMHDLFQAKVI